MRIRATCWRIVDCGVQTWWWCEQPRPVRELRIGFELLDERTRTGDRVALDARYNFTLAARSNLRRDLEGWLGRTLTRPEAAGAFDFTTLLSRSCSLTLAEIETPARRYRVIDAIGPAFGPDYPANRPPFFFSLAAFDAEAFHRLPDWLKDRVLTSPTFAALSGAGAQQWPVEHVRPATLAELIGDEIPW